MDRGGEGRGGKWFAPNVTPKPSAASQGQRRRIVDYINHMEDAQHKQDRTAANTVLAELVDYTLSHFAFEESLQEEAGYPFAKAHQRVHELFARRVNEYRDRFNAGEDVAGEIHALLSAWLSNRSRPRIVACRPSSGRGPAHKPRSTAQRAFGILACRRTRRTAPSPAGKHPA